MDAPKIEVTTEACLRKGFADVVREVWRDNREVTRAEIETWAVRYDAKLRADDSRLRGAVHLVHEEGTVFFLMYAFIVQVGEWLVIFSEHHGYKVYAVDEISYTILTPSFKKAKRVKI
jgi:hypothetical protein